MNARLVLLGVIVIVIGIVRWLSPGGIPEAGVHLGLVDAVPGYVFVGLGGAIVIIAIAAGSILDKRRASRTGAPAGQ
jgi:hypothetical protein